MNYQKLLVRMTGLVLAVLILVGCTGAPAGLTSTSTPVPPTLTSTPFTPTATLIPSTPTPILVPSTPTPESYSIQIGDIFSINSYQMKLIQVEERPSIIAATGDRIGSVDPKQDENAWLVLTIEITNLENVTSTLTLLPSNIVILEADGQQAELSSVGVSVPEDQAIMLGFIEGQKLTEGFFGLGASGRIFVIPDGPQNLLLTGVARNIIGGHNGPQWDLGNLSPEETTQLSLLFEVPTDASELTWQFLGSVPVGLPQSQTALLPDERGPGMIIEVTPSELCQVAEVFELECP